MSNSAENTLGIEPFSLINNRASRITGNASVNTSNREMISLIKVHDKIALGTIAGITGTIPQLIFNFISVQLGFAEFYSFQLTGGIYLFPGLTDYVWSLFLGGLIWLTFAGLLGITITYLMELTGQDYWWLKGLIVSFGIMFVGIYGILYTIGAAKIVPFDLATNLSEAVGNMMFGVSTAYLIVHWSKKTSRT